MSLKKSVGNMYPWVTHTHCHLGGECPHRCSYCYINSFPFGRPEKYKGPLRLIEKEFSVKYDEKTLRRNGGAYPGVIFIENCNDLFAVGVPDDFIYRIVNHCESYEGNTYVFQSKNPERMVRWGFPKNSILGTTIESNRPYFDISTAPIPFARMDAMKRFNGRKFVTIEPVLDFDVDILASWIDGIRPEFLNLGADSKGHNLPEPTVEKIMQFTEKLKGYGIELREKHNLARLKP